MIVYAPRALRDLQAIEAYIQEFNVTAAQRVIAAIKRTMATHLPPSKATYEPHSL
jgi:plasmid stabilization system protein ParE